MTSSAQVFSRNVERLRQAQGLQIKELAEKAGMLPQQLSKYLKGRAVPGLEVVDRVAKALKTSPSSLLDDGAAPCEPKPHTARDCIRVATYIGRKLSTDPEKAYQVLFGKSPPDQKKR
jgi:transcriptional regulator with XRE-family HTH domain